MKLQNEGVYTFITLVNDKTGEEKYAIELLQHPFGGIVIELLEFFPNDTDTVYTKLVYVPERCSSKEFKKEFQEQFDFLIKAILKEIVEMAAENIKPSLFERIKKFVYNIFTQKRL